jgi:VWFA-related protein
MARLPTVALALVLVAVLHASENGPQQAPPFRAEAELVTVDVVVVDKRGEPLRDLKEADFVVTEEDRRQNIQFFQPVVATDGRAGAGGQNRSYRFSTNVGAQARPGRSFVVFFDDVHLTQEQGERAKKAIDQFLTAEMQQGDLVSLVAPARALRWHARLPEGRPELLKAVAALRGANTPDTTSERLSAYEAYRIHVMHDEQMAERIGRRFSNFHVAGRDQVNLQRDEGPRPEKKGGAAGLIEPLVHSRAAEVYAGALARNRATLGALTETIESMASVRGRKSVIVVSPGFILDQELALFRQVEDAARRANVVMYFVDVRGLEAGTAFGSAQFGSPLDSRDVGAANADLTLEAEGAVSLASASGGFAVQNRNDLAAGLRRIGRESQVYYLLGYTPDGRREEGQFRRITVRVNRPGVQVRARKGYVASGAADSRTRRPDVDALEVALGSPYDATSIPVRTAAHVFGSVNDTEASVSVTVEADLRSFELKPAAGIPSDVLDLKILVTNPATGESKRHERVVEMTLPGGVAPSETSAWHPLTQSFELSPGRYQARVAVQDRNTGRVGSVTHDFEVPARSGTSLSSVILTDTIEKPADSSAGPPKPVLIVRRLLNAGATLYYQFAVFDPGRTPSGETRLKAGHIVRRADGTVIKEMAPTALLPGQAGISRFAGISLTGMPAGEYELVVTVTDEVRGQAVTVHEPFAIAEAQPVVRIPRE